MNNIIDEIRNVSEWIQENPSHVFCYLCSYDEVYSVRISTKINKEDYKKYVISERLMKKLKYSFNDFKPYVRSVSGVIHHAWRTNLIGSNIMLTQLTTVARRETIDAFLL